jgi:hypothetical protein
MSQWLLKRWHWTFSAVFKLAITKGKLQILCVRWELSC